MKFKRILSSLLCVLMLTSSFVFTASAETVPLNSSTRFQTYGYAEHGMYSFPFALTTNYGKTSAGQEFFYNSLFYRAAMWNDEDRDGYTFDGTTYKAIFAGVGAFNFSTNQRYNGDEAKKTHKIFPDTNIITSVFIGKRNEDFAAYLNDVKGVDSSFKIRFSKTRNVTLNDDDTLTVNKKTTADAIVKTPIEYNIPGTDFTLYVAQLSSTDGGDYAINIFDQHVPYPYGTTNMRNNNSTKPATVYNYYEDYLVYKGFNRDTGLNLEGESYQSEKFIDVVAWAGYESAKATSLITEDNIDEIAPVIIADLMGSTKINTANNKFVVNYDYPGDTLDYSEIYSTYKLGQENYLTPATFKLPEAEVVEGSEFAGWKNAAGTILNPGDSQTVGTGSATYTYIPKETGGDTENEYFDSEIPNTLYKLNTEKDLKVGYIGGSVTSGHGSSDGDYSWRELTRNWFRSEYPNATITEIEDSIGGTGMKYGLYRAQERYFAKNGGVAPDINFVEMAVNDQYDSLSGDLQYVYIESFIKKIYASNPKAEIIFVITSNHSYYDDEINSAAPAYPYGKAYSDLAAYYDIPVLYVFRELALDIHEANPTVTSISDPKAAPWSEYFIDTVHPKDAGYAHYAATIIDYLEAQLPHTYAPPAVEYVAKVLPATTYCEKNNKGELVLDATIVSPTVISNDNLTGTGFAVEKATTGTTLPNRFVSADEGDTVMLKFNSDTLQLWVWAAKTATYIDYSIDGGPVKTALTSFQNANSENSCIVSLGEDLDAAPASLGLADGEHIIKITHTDGNNPFDVRYFLMSDINGTAPEVSVYTGPDPTLADKTITVSANPTAGGTATVNGVSSVVVENGTEVTVIATPNSGYSFIGWTENGETVSADEEFTFEATANRNLVASFGSLHFDLYVSPTGADTKDGLTPETAVASLTKLNNIFKDAVTGGKFGPKSTVTIHIMGDFGTDNPLGIEYDSGTYTPIFAGVGKVIIKSYNDPTTPIKAYVGTNYRVALMSPVEFQNVEIDYASGGNYGSFEHFGQSVSYDENVVFKNSKSTHTITFDTYGPGKNVTQTTPSTIEIKATGELNGVYFGPFWGTNGSNLTNKNDTIKANITVDFKDNGKTDSLAVSGVHIITTPSWNHDDYVEYSGQAHLKVNDPNVTIATARAGVSSQHNSYVVNGYRSIEVNAGKITTVGLSSNTSYNGTNCDPSRTNKLVQSASGVAVLTVNAGGTVGTVEAQLAGTNDSTKRIVIKNGGTITTMSDKGAIYLIAEGLTLAANVNVDSDNTATLTGYTVTGLPAGCNYVDVGGNIYKVTDGVIAAADLAAGTYTVKAATDTVEVTLVDGDNEEVVAVVDTLPIIDKADAIFLGWSAENDGTVDDSITVTAGAKYYAIWKIIPTLSVDSTYELKNMIADGAASFALAAETASTELNTQTGIDNAGRIYVRLTALETNTRNTIVFRRDQTGGGGMVEFADPDYTTYVLALKQSEADENLAALSTFNSQGFKAWNANGNLLFDKQHVYTDTETGYSLFVFKTKRDSTHLANGINYVVIPLFGSKRNAGEYVDFLGAVAYNGIFSENATKEDKDAIAQAILDDIYAEATADTANSLTVTYDLDTDETDVYPSSTVVTRAGAVTSTSKNGTSITVTEDAYNYTVKEAVAAPENQHFVAWNNGTADVEPGTSVAITSGSVIYTPVFAAEIKINVIPEGSGTIEGLENEGVYNVGDTVTLTAKPAEGYKFLYWTENGEEVSREATISFTVEANRNLVANFEEITYTVTVIAGEGGEVEDLASATVREGTEVTINATPAAGYDFDGWYIGNEKVENAGAEYTFSVTANVTLTAKFTKKTFAVTVVGGTPASSTVEYGDDLAIAISDYDANANTYTITVNNEPVVVTVSAEGKFTLENITEATTVVISTATQTRTVTVIINPEEGGAVTGAGTYNYGENVTLTATPNKDYVFAGWFDGENEISKEATISFAANENVTYTAKFSAIEYVAEAGGNKYESLADAIAENNEVKLIANITDGTGIVIDKDVVIDLGEFTYTFASNAVGSEGTTTLGFQILKGNEVTIKNGTLTSNANSGIKRLIQNYADLTLENVILDGANLDESVSGLNATIETSQGTTTISGGKIIKDADADDIAVSVSTFGSYHNVNVTIDETEITGVVLAEAALSTDVVELEINDAKITGSGCNAVVQANNGAKVTLGGTTSVEALKCDCTTDGGYATAVWSSGEGSVVTINAGTYTNANITPVSDHYDLIYARDNGKILIYGGTFTAKTPRWTLNLKNGDGGDIKVDGQGAKFYMFNPQKALTDDAPVTEANPEGYYDYVVAGHEEELQGDYYVTVECSEVEITKPEAGSNEPVIVAPVTPGGEAPAFTVELPSSTDVTDIHYIKVEEKQSSDFVQNIEGTVVVELVLDIEFKDGAGNDIFTDANTEPVTIKIPFDEDDIPSDKKLVVYHDGKVLSKSAYRFEGDYLYVTVTHFSEITLAITDITTAYSLTLDANSQYVTPKKVYMPGDIIEVEVGTAHDSETQYKGIAFALTFDNTKVGNAQVESAEDPGTFIGLGLADGVNTIEKILVCAKNEEKDIGYVYKYRFTVLDTFTAGEAVFSVVGSVVKDVEHGLSSASKTAKAPDSVAIAMDSFKVNYNANGGTGTMGATTANKAEVTLAANGFTRTGYTFKGWALTANATTVEYQDMGTYQLFDTNTVEVTLYAVWELNSYEITAIADPAEGGTIIGAGTYNHGTTATLTATANEGYTFKNWTENGNEVSTDAAYSFTASVDRELVANFEPNIYTITATANPAEGGTVTGAGEYDHNESVTLTATAATGYTFKNWTENGNEVSTDTEYSFQAKADRELVANFEINKYAVTFNEDGGNEVADIAEQTYGTEVDLSAIVTEKTGYTFIGWVDTATQNPVTITDNKFIMPDRAVELKATWTPELYDVTFPATDNILTGNDKVAYMSDYVISIDPNAYEANKEYTVSYKIGDGNFIEITEKVEDAQWQYTIEGVTGALEFKVEFEYRVAVEVVKNYINGYYLVIANGIADGYQFTVGANNYQMYAVPQYNVQGTTDNCRAWVVSNEELVAANVLADVTEEFTVAMATTMISATSTGSDPAEVKDANTAAFGGQESIIELSDAIVVQGVLEVDEATVSEENFVALALMSDIIPDKKITANDVTAVTDNSAFVIAP